MIFLEPTDLPSGGLSLGGGRIQFYDSHQGPTIKGVFRMSVSGIHDDYLSVLHKLTNSYSQKNEARLRKIRFLGQNENTRWNVFVSIC